jgi:hypothetical protein
MKNTKWMAASLVLLTLAACSKQNGVNANGTCDENYISSLVDLGMEAMSAQTYLNSDGTLNEYGKQNLEAVMASFKNVSTKCDSFLNHYRGVSCVAQDPSTGEQVTTDTTSLSSACDSLKAALNGATATTTTGLETAIVPGTLEAIQQNSLESL